MMNDKLTELQIEILINQSLFEKKLIDENTYLKVNDQLLKSIHSFRR